jgi:PleD family two-component response regulator
MTPDALLEKADELLYRSKHAGRNRVTGEDT